MLTKIVYDSASSVKPKMFDFCLSGVYHGLSLQLGSVTAHYQAHELELWAAPASVVNTFLHGPRRESNPPESKQRSYSLWFYPSIVHVRLCWNIVSPVCILCRNILPNNFQNSNTIKYCQNIVSIGIPQKMFVLY